MIYRNRKLIGLKPWNVGFADITSPPEVGDDAPLSVVLEQSKSDRIYLCGKLSEMTREYVEEPLAQGWSFACQYVHKFRSPVYRREGREVSVKLISESWFPGCHSMVEALPAWKALVDEWSEKAKLPLLSTPSKSGQALLWESLPKGADFPSLPDDVAGLIRANSPQHRLEILQGDYAGERVCYDGRWMYGALAGLDRLPVGEPVRSCEFTPYAPGWYRVNVAIPASWHHIGLVPLRSEAVGWVWPSEPGALFETWASEPELTLAQSCGWSIEVLDGYKFAKGRPLGLWAKKLAEMRERLSLRNKFAASAIREILNHTIGSFHVEGYEREMFVSDAEWPEWFRANRATHRQIVRGEEYRERVDGGWMVAVFVPDKSALSFYMPHWSAQIWALERARVAQWALRCDRSSLIEIRGDAIYASCELPLEDNGNLGQLRKKVSA